ncbi:MAG: Kynureninase (L-kynurenine hydrolase) [Trizodia sp. TS-e1964]|nr:MAG: Kynureninase (L-kynurenine hydrolase) [Trizodia sp. TS-e1964]
MSLERSTERAYALALDAKDPLRHYQAEFIIPSKSALTSSTLKSSVEANASGERCIYLCGNSLGLQPRRTASRVTAHLDAWATKGVHGHFQQLADSPLPHFIDTDEVAARGMAQVVGAMPSEVAVMETLTANLHLLLASFYTPTAERYKIIIEGKAFPSDHYAIESQIKYHHLDPQSAMIMIESASPNSPLLSIQDIYSAIEKHASSAALLLLPGIQFFTGQYFDIPKITAYAHSKGIIVGWDCAHAAGNVVLQLHEWDVDFAVWCTYKYLNAGPGSVAGLFVHEKHGKVNMDVEPKDGVPYRPRLCGWWGGDKSVRFNMDNRFIPIPGAGGFQVGNPSALALAPVIASLEVFNSTNMSAIEKKSKQLTGYLEWLLNQHIPELGSSQQSFIILTPSNPAERGAQLSLGLNAGLLDHVMQELIENGVVLDERKPDVIRVAPAPLFNSYLDVWQFVQIFQKALANAEQAKLTRLAVTS